MEIRATVLSRLASTSIGPFIWPVASACALELGDRVLHGWRADVVGLDRDHGRVVAAREGLVELLQRLDLGDRDVVDAGRRRVQRERRDRQGDQHGGGGEGRDDRAAEDAVEDRVPEAALAVLAAEPAQERDAALLDPVAEPAEERRGAP